MPECGPTTRARNGTAGPAQLTAYTESVSGPVTVYLGNDIIGTVDMTGSGGDYVLPISLDIMGRQTWNLGSDINLYIRFGLSSPGDSFQLSTEYDYEQDSGFREANNHYGIGIRDNYIQTYTPEPSTLWLASLGLGILLCHGLTCLGSAKPNHPPAARDTPA